MNITEDNSTSNKGLDNTDEFFKNAETNDNNEGMVKYGVDVEESKKTIINTSKNSKIKPI